MARRSKRTPRGVRAVSRRDLFEWMIRGTAAAALTPSLVGLCCRQAMAALDAQRTSKKKLILLWLEGGPSQLDTFDPKPGAPTQGPMGVLRTELPGLQMGAHLPGLAKQASKLSVIRTMTSKEGSHSRARELLHTGYTPNPAVNFPTIGSIVAHEIGDMESELPPFVQIDGPLANPSYLGIESAPFRIVDPTGKIGNLAPPPGVDPRTVKSREALRSIVDGQYARRKFPATLHADEVQRLRAQRLMNSKLLRAFDLDEEKEQLRDAYGRQNFGQGVLLARRLIENGVSAVEVVLDGWDTHHENYPRTAALCQQLDPAFSTLVDDLGDRGLLDDTLVVCMGEFGRTPLQRGDGRGHWPNNYCVVLAGGGVKPGTVVGTTNETGEQIVERPVQVADLFATMAHFLEIDPRKEFNELSRPVQLVDPEGYIVEELLRV